jgi:XTP/dITP diphosphohydrolase
LIKWFLKGVGPDGICQMVHSFPSAKATAETAIAVCDGSSLTFASGNEAKRHEYTELLAIPNLRSVDPNIPEPQTLNLDSLVEAKIRSVQNAVTPPFFVEHTGLSIEGWNGFPGGVTADFLKSVGCKGICRMLSGYSGIERAAKARVVVGY